jgi:3-phenylpropionate/trans-cinnamate dioxygenase ferredoxin subunit/naphthalene 1,2-dioxygenase system ferredoxin subunit
MFTDPLADDAAVFEAAAARLDELVQLFEAQPPSEQRDQVFALLEAADAMHRAALGRLVDRLRATGAPGLLERLSADPLVNSLLELYDMAPAAAVSPPITPVPSAREIIPLAHGTRTTTRPLRRPVFQTIAPVSALHADTLTLVEVAGTRLLVAMVDGDVHVTRSTCPGSMAPLELGSFDPPLVTCPWHGDVFDIRSGTRVSGQPGPPLPVLPARVVDGVVQVAIDTAADEGS